MSKVNQGTWSHGFMTRIPNLCCGIALDWLEDQGVNPEIWVLGLPPRLEQLRDPERPLDWGLFTELCRRLASIGGRNADLYEIGRALGRRAFADEALQAAIESTSLDDLFELELAERAACLFPGLEVSATASEPGIIAIHALLREGDHDCRAFFEIARGALSELPTILGDAPVWVDIDHAERWARYRVALFASVESRYDGGLSAPLAHADERHRALMSADGLMELGSVILDEICAGHPAAALWVVSDLIPDELRERLAFESAVGHSIGEALGSAGGAGSDPAYLLLGMRGQPIKPPTHSLALALPNRDVGRLDLWATEPPIEDPVESLDTLLPWVAVSLENACLRARIAAPHPAEEIAAKEHARIAPELEDRWRTTLERTADVICEVAADGRVLFVNLAVEALLGHPPDHYCGQSFLEFVLPEEQEALLEDFQKLISAGDPACITFRATHRSGSIRTLEALCTAHRSESGELRLICSMRDVTDRQRVEAELRQSADRYRSLVENDAMLVGVATPDGRMVVPSPHLERTLGIPPSEDLGIQILRRIHPDDRQPVIRAWLLSKQTGEPGRADLRFLKPDGTQLWFEAAWRRFEGPGGEEQLSVVMHEITARKKSESALRAISQGLSETGEDFHVRLVEHLSDGLGMSGAVLSRIDPNEPGHVHTLGMWFEGEQQENVRFALEGTPCAQVFKGEACSFPASVDKIFPNTREIFGRPIEAYVGAPLMDSAGHVIGGLAVVHTRALAEPQLARSMLEVFAQRAATELCREDAETARLESEKRFAALSQSSSDVIVELSKPHGIRYVSPGVLHVLGYTPEEALDADLFARVHAEDREPLAAALSRVFEDEEPGHLRFRISHRDGDWRWLDVTYRAYRTEGAERRAVALCRDITQRTLAEQEREQLVSITQNSSDIILLASLTGGIRFLNAAGHEALGIDRDDDAQHNTLFDFLSADDAERMRFKIMPTVHRNQRWTGEVELLNLKTGARLPTQATLFLIHYPEADQAVAIAAICRDLSYSKHAEQQLRESEERYRMLAENPYDLISELDADGRFVYVSPNFQEILQYAPEDLLGRDVFQLIPEEDREEIQRIFKGAVRTESTFHAPFRIRHRDGSHRWVDSTARAYRTAQGQVMAVLISRDITEQRRAEDALRQSEDRLRQAQKMEAIGRLAGGIAHDFNNLLTAIIGYCDLLLEELGAEHPGRSDAEEILKAADRAGALTRQLLAFSRRQVLQPKVLDLNALVADLDRMLRRLIGEDIELRASLDGELAPVKADPGQLEQVILNLVVNARDAMPRGGRITIGTANVEIHDSNLDDEAAIPPGSWVTLQVSDTGSGIDESVLQRIFDPFFTTKPPGEGTGLGLSTVIGIVSQSGGHIRVNSEPNKGTTFTISLPRVSEQLTESEGFTELAQLRGDETILVVEDAGPVRKLVERYLERHGYTVLGASSSIGALRHARRHPGPVHLLLTDVILPRMDGREIAERVEALRPGIPVVYMSGFTDDSLSRHGVLADDVILLEKPFTPSELLTMVRQVLDAEDDAD
jgi:PAS domain S-box-containing protein